MIFSTILKHTGNQLGIFISNDNDFSGLFNEVQASNLKRCTSLAEVQIVLAKAFNVVSTDMSKEIIKISMDVLQPFYRDVPSFELSEYNGGTKFRNGDIIMAGLLLVYKRNCLRYYSRIKQSME